MSLQNILLLSLISPFRTKVSVISIPEALVMTGFVQTRLVHDARQKTNRIFNIRNTKIRLVRDK